MMPFDTYPGGGRKQLGWICGGTCRHDYGLQLQKLTKQDVCAYCGVSLVDTYEHWLMMSVDHVVPTKVGLAIGIQPDWLRDYANLVLCCSGCNGFRNRGFPGLAEVLHLPATLDEFFELRDHVFALRKGVIATRREEERAFYDGKPWTKY